VKHVVRNTWATRSFVITMSRASGVAEELYGTAVGVPNPSVIQECWLS
jgi:hypothetical protein